MKALIIDNYDSFTFNLVQIIEQFDSEKCEWKVVKNDECSLQEVANYDKILFSPGPGLPSEVPIMSQILTTFWRTENPFWAFVWGIKRLQSIMERLCLTLTK